MSLTRPVPPDVPSLFHSSAPLTPSLALKNSVAATLVRETTPPLNPTPTRMSFTMVVPASVPSLFHSSRPWVASEAAK